MVISLRNAVPLPDLGDDFEEILRPLLDLLDPETFKDTRLVPGDTRIEIEVDAFASFGKLRLHDLQLDGHGRSPTSECDLSLRHVIEAAEIIDVALHIGPEGSSPHGSAIDLLALDEEGEVRDAAAPVLLRSLLGRYRVASWG
jgi:hypothetical protein